MSAARRFLPDTNCIIATISTWHPDHARAKAEMDRRVVSGESLVIAAHSLAETYSVLTRMPTLRRVAPLDVVNALRRDVLGGAETVTLDSASYRRVLEQAPTEGIVGGRIYDALIAACAVAAKVDAFITFNERHFRPLLPESVEVVVPSE